MPNKVPMHYDITGTVDKWGNRIFIFEPSIIGIILWIGLTIFEKFPHVYNYSNLPSENVEKQFKNSRIMFSVLKTEVVLFFAYSSWQDVQISRGHYAGLREWDFVVFMVVMFATIAYFVNKKFQRRK